MSFATVRISVSPKPFVAEFRLSNSDDYAKQMDYQDGDFQVADRLQQVAAERGAPNMEAAGVAALQAWSDCAHCRGQ